MPRSPERLYQLGFDEHFQEITRFGVTPENFTGLQFPTKKEIHIPHPGRFVREVPDRIQITSPAEAAKYLLQNVFTPFADFDQEELWSLLCNTRNFVTHITRQAMIYRGSVNMIQVRTAEVLKEAVRVNAPALILAHVHPSGDPSPSPEDITVSQKIVAGGRLLDIEVLDHLIIGDGRYVSLKERGLL